MCCNCCLVLYSLYIPVVVAAAAAGGDVIIGTHPFHIRPLYSRVRGI